MCGCSQVLSYSVELGRSEADGIAWPLQSKPSRRTFDLQLLSFLLSLYLMAFENPSGR